MSFNSIEKRLKPGLYKCPRCLALGRHETLGALLDKNTFVIQRVASKERRGYTKVTGEAFVIWCGSCGEPAYSPIPIFQTGEESRGTI